VFEARAASLCSLATCGLRHAKTRAWVNPKLESDCIPGRWNGTSPTFVGRGRALEIILGANDFDGETAERYGYVNRALPDTELDVFVDTLARRIASFDRRALSAAKTLVNNVSLPSADRLLEALNSFQTALTWPEAQRRIQALLARGLQRNPRPRETTGQQCWARSSRRSQTRNCFDGSEAWSTSSCRPRFRIIERFCGLMLIAN